MKKRNRLGIEALEDRLVPSGQPNIVFIMTDDQDVGTMQYMPRVQELLADEGVTFENSFVTSPICAPSNATALTGQYNFNHGIVNNLYPTGGALKFAESGGDQSTLATWLDDAGYHTARVASTWSSTRKTPLTSRRGGTSGTRVTTGSRASSATA
jgi:arylsulfatase A-like enzyme